MNNFIFYNPTRIVFGKGQIGAIAEQVPAGANVLMLYGGGSIKKNGVYEQVISALKNYKVQEFSGIEPNPAYETCMKAVELIKKEKIDFLLAVGGGSVVDATKFIAAAALFESDDPWAILEKQTPVTKALPFGTVLTLPATGTEMNMGAVVTKADTQDKLFFKSEACFPQFSVLDPETTFSLPPPQIANGVVDAFTHVMEQYLTYPANAYLQDGFSESILKTLIKVGPVTLAKPTDYEARANMMWCTTQALNGLIGSGVPQDWATHMIGHEITALHGLDHAQTLAIFLPSVLQYKKVQKLKKLVQYATNVWGFHAGTDEEKAEIAIQKTREFFESLGLKTRLSEYGVTAHHIPALVKSLEKHDRTQLGEHGDIVLKDSEAILQLSL